MYLGNLEPKQENERTGLGIEEEKWKVINLGRVRRGGEMAEISEEK